MKTALLLIDLQRDFLASPNIQPVADILISRVVELLAGCRRRRIPIIHVWTTVQRDKDQRLPHWKRDNRWLCVAGTVGHQPPEALCPQTGETVTHKTGFNAFAGGELEQALRALECDTVLLAGIHLHACVRTAAVECLERGWQVCVAEDAVASNDPIHAAATRRWLEERCVHFEAGGRFLARLAGKESPPLVHCSPRTTKQVLFEVPVAGEKEAAAAAAAARAGTTRWTHTDVAEKLRIFQEFGERLIAATPELALQLALEIGKPVSHAREEIRRAVANLRDVLKRAAVFESLTREPAGIIRRQPVGVVAVISPWNNPVAIPIGKIVPALVYGNTVVWKPAPAATQIARVILQLLKQAGLPADAVRLLTGDHNAALWIAADKNVDAVTLTGSAQAGYAIQEICARRVVPLQAELNGNNAAIVWDDADLRSTAAQVAWGAFGFAGQRCTANRRVIVSEAGFETLHAALKSAAERLAWGDPLDEHTEIGPVINIAKQAEHTRLVDTAHSAGAAHAVDRLFESRAGEAWVKQGAYAQPAIVCCDQPDHQLVNEETMSPLLVVQRANDFDQALELCNGVRFGLAAALFSAAPELQEKFLAECQAGILKLNSSTAGVDATLPFGGWKASGIGPPEHGVGDALFYSRLQAVYEAKPATSEARRSR